MKLNLRRVLFTSCLVIVLIAIAIVCFIVGRGHTIYFDNKAVSGSISSYDTIEVYYDGGKVGTLNDGDRASQTITGQKLDVKLIVKKTESSSRETLEREIELPYNMDGIVINLPAYLEGADVDTYLTEFVSQQAKEEEIEDVQVDEFGISTEEE